MHIRFLILTLCFALIFALGYYIADIVEPVWLVHAIIGALIGAAILFNLGDLKTKKIPKIILSILGSAILVPVVYWILNVTTGLETMWQ